MRILFFIHQLKDDMLVRLVVVVCVVIGAVRSESNVTCEQGKYPPKPERRIQEYVVNLDLPPSQRWQQVAFEKRHEIGQLMILFRKAMSRYGAGEIITLLDLLGDNLDSFLPNPYRDELEGIANVTGIYVGEIFVYNMFYELSTMCTSIVAHDAAGKMYHARNLDFGLFFGWDAQNHTWELTELLRASLVNINWQKNGQTVFKSVNFAGFVGVLTGVKQGKFTFSINARETAEDIGFKGILEWIRDRKGSIMSFLSRETLETAPDFTTARDKLANTQLIAPAYFILGGTKPGEGVVITRDREGNTTDIWPMTDKTAGGWYVLETNYDHWKQPLIIDNRRDPANKCMQQMGYMNAGFPGIFNVLSTKPVLNLETSYTALMQVDTGTLESWRQYCEGQCSPL